MVIGSRMLGVLRYIAFVLSFLGSLIVDTILFIFPGRRHSVFFNTKITTRIMLTILGVKVNVLKKKKFSNKKKFLIISNHQSLMDIVLLYSIVDTPFSFIAKKELFFVPFLGLYLIVTGALSINRKKIRKAHKDLQKAIKTLKRGKGLLIFPEGTRTREDEVKSFKRGFVRMAKDADVDILPVVMRGSGNIMSKGSMIIKGNQKVDIIVGDLISIRDLSDADALQKVENFFQKNYEELKKLNIGS